MEESLVSSVAFKSNIQIISEKTILDDRHFLSMVRDPFGIEKIHRKNIRLTKIQSDEYKKVSMHCAYAFKDDYPFGTIVDVSGNEKVVCKCINTECIHFLECRPDFDLDELAVVDENDNVKDKLTIMDSEILSVENSDVHDVDGDSEAASSLYNNVDKEAIDSEAKPVSEENPVDTISDNPDLFEKKNEAVTKSADATFASFIEVEQDAIITSGAEERIVVNAGPGTGKTWTLVEKVKYMLSTGNVEPENILILCFSRAAVDVIKSRLRKSADKGELPLTWHLVEVRTFDSFSTYMLAWLADNIPELLPDNFLLEAMDYDARISEAASVFAKDKEMLAEYDHIIVDEVQDLVGVRAELVISILESLPVGCGFTLLGDSCQALYDYLAEDNPDIMTSSDFYKKLFHEFPCIKYYTMNKNYRQGDELGNSTDSYRNAILTGKPEDRIREAAILNEKIDMADIDLKHFSAETAKKYTKTGSVGILTRTNGQALQISTWLRNEGIDHQLQNNLANRELAGWISNVILSTQTDVIGKDEFTSIFEKIYPLSKSVTEGYWKALISTQIDTGRNYFNISDLLCGLLSNSRDSLLFEEPEQKLSPITVSNIHRAKGREFDTVLVIEDVISQMTELEKDDELEHKVCYVALTRPKKKIERVNLETQYIYIMKDESRRCFRGGGFYRKKYLSHFEVGEPGDLDIRSFAVNDETQKRIRETIHCGTRLKLIKCPEDTRNYIVYRIVAEDYEKETLGYTSRKFYSCMYKAIQRVFDNYGNIAYKYFPRILGDVYADGITTCIATNDEGIDGAKQFGDMFIWRGISISGFAQLEKDSY